MIIPFKTENKKFIFVDYSTRNRVFEDFEFDFIYPFENGYSIVKANDKFGIINLKGILTVPIIYDRVIEVNEFYAVISLNYKLGIIKLEDGKLIIPPIYENISNISENLILFSKEEDLYKNVHVDTRIKYGFLNTENIIEIEPKYTPAFDFSEGLSLVGNYAGMDNDYNEIIKYGYIDKNENLVIDFIFDEGTSFVNGKAEVKLDGDFFSINKKGERIKDSISTAKESSTKKLNIYQQNINLNGGILEKFGFKSSDGKIIIKPIYDSVQDFKNGLSLVSINNDFFYVDINGEELYHRIEYIG